MSSARSLAWLTQRTGWRPRSLATNSAAAAADGASPGAASVGEVAPVRRHGRAWPPRPARCHGARHPGPREAPPAEQAQRPEARRPPDPWVPRPPAAQRAWAPQAGHMRTTSPPCRRRHWRCSRRRLGDKRRRPHCRRSLGALVLPLPSSLRPLCRRLSAAYRRSPRPPRRPPTTAAMRRRRSRSPPPPLWAAPWGTTPPRTRHRPPRCSISSYRHPSPSGRAWGARGRCTRQRGALPRDPRGLPAGTCTRCGCTSGGERPR
mmetsp:Transcript_79697/g.231349  ORF Transcript_79697/g.231349 Transcript_79697/m.231349 type:complete len:262 (-) Transcript_79697:217-1002(-)